MQLQVKEMCATASEIKEFHLEDLVSKVKDANVVSNEAGVNNSDDDFVEYVPRHLNPAAMLSDDSVKKIKNQLKKLETSHKK